MNKKQKAAIAVERLKERYPKGECSLEYKKPYELLIAARLSAQCTDARVNIVTKMLFEKYPTLESFANAKQADIEEIIKPCGLFRTKAKSICELAKKLISDYDGIVPDSIDELVTLPGVGRKIANLIVGDVYHQPAVVADTHCIRISNRLGLTGSTVPEKVERELREILVPSESNDFCHRLVDFGRDVCKARGEKCEMCEMTDICDYYKHKKE